MNLERAEPLIFIPSTLLTVPLSSARLALQPEDRKSTRLNSCHVAISYAVFCLKKKTSVAAGPWIRLYQISAQPVLNAPLQSYASSTGDMQAASLAARMQSAAASTLFFFNTRYSS